MRFQITFVVANSRHTKTTKQDINVAIDPPNPLVNERYVPDHASDSASETNKLATGEELPESA